MSHSKIEKRAKKKAKAHQRYYVDEEVVAGLTQGVLGQLNKKAIPPWANKLGLHGISLGEYVDELASIGSLAHELCTNHLIGAETDKSDYSPNQVDAAENAFLSFLQWLEKNPVEETVWVEKPLVSRIHRYGGTADIYCIFETGRHEIVELKTGKGLYPENTYQGVAQRQLAEENGYRVDGVRVLNIPRSEDEQFLEHIVTDKEFVYGWIIVKACIDIYWAKREMKHG